VVAEEPHPDPQPALVQADPVAVAHEELRAEATPEREADIVSDDRAGGRDRDDPADREVVRRARKERGRDERRFAGHRETEALEHDEHEDHEIPVRRHPALERVRRDEGGGCHVHILTCA
jgi:hypothetical protein